MDSDYRQLKVWQRSFGFVTKVYDIIKILPIEERFGLCDQMRRCSISIPSNIAEGQRRNSNKEFIHFLYIYRGSVAELQTQLLLCASLKYSDEAIIDSLCDELTVIDKMLSGLISRLSQG